MSAEDKLFYVNLSLLKDKVLSYNAFTISAIAAAGLLVLVSVGVMAVSKKGRLTMGIVLLMFCAVLIMMVLIYVDSRETAKSIDAQVQAMKTKYYDDIQALECPMFFTKRFKPEGNVFVCENSDGIMDGNVVLQQLKAKPDTLDPAYPWPVVVS